MQRRRAAHGVRGGRLPEHLRVLGRPHRHLHDPRRALHAGVRLLPRRHAQAAARSTSTSRAASPTRCATLGLAHAVVTSVARDDLADGGRVGVRRDDRRDPAPRRPATTVEVLIPDCKGDAGGARRDLRRAARRAEPQPRDRRPAPARGAAVGGATRGRSPLLGRAKAAGLVTKSGIIVGMGETDDEVEGALVDLRGGRRRHRHDRPVPAAVGGAPPGRALVDARRVRRDRRLRPRARLRARRERAARALELPRPRRAPRRRRTRSPSRRAPAVS